MSSVAGAVGDHLLADENVHVSANASELVADVEGKAGREPLHLSHDVGDRRAVDAELLPLELREEREQVPREFDLRHRRAADSNEWLSRNSLKKCLALPDIDLYVSTELNAETCIPLFEL